MEKALKKVKVLNFGKGWGIIAYCFLSFWFFAGMVNDSAANIIIPAIEAQIGTPLGGLLKLVSIASIIGAAFMFFIAWVNEKIGPRYTSAICLFLIALGYLGLGNSTNLTMYMISEILLQCGGPSAVFVAAASLTARWYPKRSGMVLGYTTMGLNFASMVFIPIAAFLVGRFGVRFGVVIPAAFCAIVAVLGIIFVRNDPREYNVNPDNVSDEEYKKDYYDTGVKEDYSWRITKFFNKPMFWIVIVASCLFQFANYIVVTQLVNRGMEFGFSLVKAISLMSICALIGFAGSWIAGFLDFKLGTKKAMILMAIWYGIAFIFNISKNPVLVYVFYAMFGIAIGGGNNFFTSLPVNVFGRHLFAKLNIIMCPIAQCLAAMGVLVNGISLTRTGKLDLAYIVAACAMVLLIILVIPVKLHKFDPDYMTKEEGDKFMADLKSK